MDTIRQAATYPLAWPGFSFVEESGAMELAVCEAAAGRASRPEKVTAILAEMLAEIDGKLVTPALVRGLSSGTREWLLQQVAARCRPAQDWFEVQCGSCGTAYDIAFDLAALPRSAPRPGFPVVAVETSVGRLNFELPNGSHEEALAGRRVSGKAGLRELLARCALFGAAEEVLAALPRKELEQIDKELDRAAPDCADHAQSYCPSCGAENRTRIDPFDYAFPSETQTLRDVHVLSSAYQWSEAAVLNLPTRRRRSYVAMIAESRKAGIGRAAR